MALRFFFYGTLLHSIPNAVTSAVQAKLGAGVPASVQGRLYAIMHSGACYPALVISADGYAVHGMLYEAEPDFTAADLALLDRYEEWDPGDPGSSEYLRKAMPVITTNGAVVQAHIYLYNAPLPVGAPEIVGGSFADYLAANGLRAFASDA